jgi:hypothetical protein
LKNKKLIKKNKRKALCRQRLHIKGTYRGPFVDGLHLVTSTKNNMKNVTMEMKDKILLRKHSVIGTINDKLKNICSIEHSRHRSTGNFITNLLSAMIAYCFFSKKPTIKYEVVNPDLLMLF